MDSETGFLLVGIAFVLTVFVTGLNLYKQRRDEDRFCKLFVNHLRNSKREWLSSCHILDGLGLTVFEAVPKLKRLHDKGKIVVRTSPKANEREHSGRREEIEAKGIAADTFAYLQFKWHFSYD